MEQSIAPNKQIRMKTPKKNVQGNFISNNPSENFDTYAGLLNPPSRAASFSHPYPLSASVFNQQPPLLPLPHVSPIQHHQHQPLLRQGLSLPPPSRKNRTKDMSLTPKKSKPTKREEVKKRSGTQSILIVASDNRWGPDPKDLPRHLLTSKVVPGKGNNVEEMVSGWVFNLSPPPSSLPLPKFSIRSKLSCNAEAARGVDAGATNNLRRLLRL
ncbi:uncharacterized protein LOC113864733 [Abrus precatorius]|uniref:Uncharacterized protein LOC113864733 n=1 Tax=Abrus precatorius TaxID=3816 RepID=A0A8B8LEL4_ABRPR|nr:uncharacterized protein LOC113864733 [Abrus precatorius]